MNKEEIIPLIEKLDAEPDKKKRKNIVDDFCKERGLKSDDVWKQIEEVRAIISSNGNQNNNDPTNGNKDEKKKVVLVSHKTTYEKYRCAGLVLTRKPENHLVTAEQLVKLRQDPWVVLGGEPTEGNKPE